MSGSADANSLWTPVYPRAGVGGVSVMLVDQVPLFRDGLSALVAHTPALRWLGSAHTPRAALALCGRARPDIIMIDSALDPLGQLTRLLVGSTGTSAILSLVATQQRTAQYVCVAMGSGVHGLVLRSAEPAQLIEAVRRTHLERRYVDPALSVLANATRDCRDQDLLQPLSRREYQVLQLIADGLDNSSIAKTLFVSIETVRTHVKSILRKLRARDRAHAIAMAFNYGVLLPHAGEQPDESPAADGEAHSSNGRVLRTPQHRAG